MIPILELFLVFIRYHTLSLLFRNHRRPKVRESSLRKRKMKTKVVNRELISDSDSVFSRSLIVWSLKTREGTVLSKSIYSIRSSLHCLRSSILESLSLLHAEVLVYRELSTREEKSLSFEVQPLSIQSLSSIWISSFHFLFHDIINL